MGEWGARNVDKSFFVGNKQKGAHECLLLQAFIHTTWAFDKGVKCHLHKCHLFHCQVESP
jgi:hypothetical protein